MKKQDLGMVQLQDGPQNYCDGLSLQNSDFNNPPPHPQWLGLSKSGDFRSPIEKGAGFLIQI